MLVKGVSEVIKRQHNGYEYLIFNFTNRGHISISPLVQATVGRAHAAGCPQVNSINGQHMLQELVI